MSSLFHKTASELAGLVRSKELSPVELMEETLKRIDEINPEINAFVALRPDEAMDEAKAMAERLARGENPGPLGGIPVGVKDLEHVAGMVTSFGSIPFKDNVVRHDSIQVARLKAAGAIIVGKTNTPEFGYTGFTKNRLFGVTRNPWDRERTPGGSSGGSAAAVTAAMVPLATGSDAGGSIRIPACYCGCFGMKPSYGRIPLSPVELIHMSRTWTLGPLSRTVTDAALYLDCTAGYHAGDPDSLLRPPCSYAECLKKPLPSLKMGFSRTLGYARVQKGILSLVEEAVHSFDKMGHEVEIWDEGLPDVSAVWNELTTAALYAQLRRDFDKMRPELGKTMVSAIDHTRGLNLGDIIHHQEIRNELNHKLETLFDRFDLLLSPTMPTEAFGAKGPPPAEIDGHPIPLLHAVAFTYPFNISGHPAATVPVGFTEKGLPAGLQIIGPRHREDLVLQAAFRYEQAHPWKDHWPDM
jgi:aspartyl-tRNA(Asn)/glutamyl-tRNA(Gln) amidotransferase subunit A